MAKAAKSKLFTDKGENSFKGSVKDGLMTLWRTSWIPKKEYSFSIEIEEIDYVLSVFGNSASAIRELVERKMRIADERWIEETKDPGLRQERRRRYDNDSKFGKFSALDSQRIDSACRVVCKLYELETGAQPLSWLERIHTERAKI